MRIKGKGEEEKEKKKRDGKEGTPHIFTWIDTYALNRSLFCLQNAQFGNLILGKIIKFVATRCQILRLKCTKFNFSWSSAPDPAGGAYSAPPDPLDGYKGAYI